jgi:hypothetical protein
MKGATMATQSVTTGPVLIARSVWMMFGPALLLILAFKIMQVGNGWFTAADWVFFLVLGATILARWFEFQKGEPIDATGEPAKPRDLPRYAAVTACIGFSVWVVANLIGNYWREA